jgi:putative hydrolase of the HAD superfamily
MSRSAKWVMFDYGNVISKPQPEEDLAALAGEAETTVAEFSEAYWPRRIDYDRADLDAWEYWSTVAEQLDQRWEDRRIARLMWLDTVSWLHLRAGTVALVEDLAAAGHQLALLSNAPAEVADAVSLLPVAQHFEHLVFSCHVKATKPDPDCYHAALGRLGAQPADVIFIDDRAENVAGADRLGIRGQHFTSPDAARSQLSALLKTPVVPRARRRPGL